MNRLQENRNRIERLNPCRVERLNVRILSKKNTSLSGRKKSAILLLTLGPEIAAEVYRHLSDSEIEQITVEVANSGTVSFDQTSQIIEEFYHTAMAKQYINRGGMATAREILEKALGPAKALEILERMQGVLAGSPFDFLKHVDPKYLIEFLQSEHPQTIALILSHLKEDHAATILSALQPDVQKDVAIRIATMEQTNPEVIAEVERIMERKMATVFSQDYTPSGGVDALAELLNRVDRTTSQSIIASLENDNQELANAIKKQMFTFDDLVILDDRVMQKVLREIDARDLIHALKGASDPVRSQIFSNVSTRMADTLKEDMDLMGPVRIQAVEDSQQKILNYIRSLAENGEIDVAPPGEEYFE
jgi:flagellar motor switch protein FliG